MGAVAMFSMMRAQLFRIAKSRFIVFFVLIIMLFAFATPFALWLHNVWPAFAATGFVEIPDEPLPTLQLYGVSFVAGSFLAMDVSVATVYYVAEDFKSGFIKNLVQARGGRASYAAAMILCSIVIAAVAVIIGMLVVEVALRVQGYVPVPPSAVDMLQWFVQLVLCMVAYATVAIFLTAITGSETVATIGGILIAGGAVESLLKLILANLPGIPVVLRDCLDGYLATDLAMLSQGIVCDPLTFVQAIVTILVAGVGCVLVLRRRNLG